MKAYQNKKLVEGPDVADIREEGRRSAVGKFRGKGGDYRGYCKSKNKRVTRRLLKRADKAKTARNLKDDTNTLLQEPGR